MNEFLHRYKDKDRACFLSRRSARDLLFPPRSHDDQWKVSGGEWKGTTT